MSRRPGRRPAVMLAVVMTVSVIACTPGPTVSTQAAPEQSESLEAKIAAEATMQPAELVNLTIYLRRGRGGSSHLVPVIREVPVTDQLPRKALELLIEGPRKSDPRGLRPVVPRDARIRRFEVRDSTAVVDFSSGIVRGSKAMRAPERGFLALSAIANTLTEFPDINYVRPTVDGRRGGDTWGGWGLPAVLVRDKGVIEPPQRVSLVASPDRFRRRTQQVGLRRQRPLRVAALRVRPTATYLRVSAEIAPPGGEGELLGPVPRSTARRAGKAVVLRIRGAGRRELAGNLRDKFDDPTIKRAVVRVKPKQRAVVVRVRPQKARGFWLHTQSKPARVVLDIRR